MNSWGLCSPSGLLLVFVAVMADAGTTETEQRRSAVPRQPPLPLSLARPRGSFHCGGGRGKALGSGDMGTRGGDPPVATVTPAEPHDAVDKKSGLPHLSQVIYGQIPCLHVYSYLLF